MTRVELELGRRRMHRLRIRTALFAIAFALFLALCTRS